MPRRGSNTRSWMGIRDLNVHPGIKADLSGILSGREIAERSFRDLAKAGCNSTYLAFLLVEPRRPKVRSETAEDRKAEREELRAMARTLRRLARQTKAVLDRHRYFEQHLFGCRASSVLQGVLTRNPNYRFEQWFECRARMVEGLAQRHIPRLLLNPRDMQRQRLVEYVRHSTGRPHYALVADLLNACEDGPEADEGVTEAYLKKIDGALRSNQRKWHEKWRKGEAAQRKRGR
jgi:hypothetical protein